MVLTEFLQGWKKDTWKKKQQLTIKDYKVIV